MTAFPVLLTFAFTLFQDIIPVSARGSKADPLAADLLGQHSKSLRVDVTLGICIRRSNKLRKVSGDEISERLGCLRRPASASAEIKRAIAEAFDRRQAHRVDRSFGHTDAKGTGRTEAEQNLGPARCEAAPLGSASLWTQDMSRAWRVAEALPHGAVNVNETSNYWDQLAPFGGAGKSGVGRELSQWFLDNFTERKLIVFDLGGPVGDRRIEGGW